jgi:hypothetical protein
MPFTISHAAVVLPFSRLLARWRLLSAVVIGAMVPDFGLFLPWPTGRIETHSAAGLISFCVPVGLASYWVFQYLIKTPVFELLPEGAYARWRAFSSPADFTSIRQWILVACGVLAGAVSHLVLDAFTHDGARGVRMIPWLEDPLFDIGTHHVRGFRLLQDGSSLILLVVVVGFAWYSLRPGRARAVPGRLLGTQERRAWLLGFAAATAVLGPACFTWARLWEPRSYVPITNVIAVAALRGLVVALVCACFALNWRLRTLRQRARADA